MSNLSMEFRLRLNQFCLLFDELLLLPVLSKKLTLVMVVSELCFELKSFGLVMARLQRLEYLLDRDLGCARVLLVAAG